MTLLEELESQIHKAAQETGPAVVGLGRGWSTGSGVVIAQGRGLTNAHNLRHDETTVTFADGRGATRTVRGAAGGPRASSRPLHAASVGRGAGGSAVRSSTPRRCREAHRAAPSSTRRA